MHRSIGTYCNWKFAKQAIIHPNRIIAMNTKLVFPSRYVLGSRNRIHNTSAHSLQRASFNCGLCLALIVWTAGGAEAGLVFNFNGTVYDVANPTSPAGINPFGASVGSTISGSFAYNADAVPNTISPTSGIWNLPVTAGGTNWMELSSAGFQLRSTSTTMVDQGYRQENPTNSPLLLPQLGGFDFQFEGSNVATLNTASLPTGFTFRNAGFLLAFHSNNPNLGPAKKLLLQIGVVKI
jgi:hypothetical protein